MNLRELLSPIRIYWDLPDAASDEALCLRLCEEIKAAKILFLSLREPAVPVGECCRAVLGGLGGGMIGISLTVRPAAAEPSLLEDTVEAGASIFVDTSSMEEVRSFYGGKEGGGKSGVLHGVSFEIGKGLYREIPELIAFCLEKGIPDIIFPIQRLALNGPCVCAEREEEEALAAALRKIDYRALRIAIHDPFLWQLFYPDADYHEGGCQAANSMLYVSPDYKVYPCPAMPGELGDLHETTLLEIILSSAKKEVRRSLLDPPGECGPCERVAACLGGCRGRAFAAAGSLELRDPACRRF